jgi:alpha-ribazole phosphatase
MLDGGRPLAGPLPAGSVELWCWRHPRAEGAAGRCIGRTDLPVDPRRARRLAHRIRTIARRHGLPREASVSPLRRCRDVGRWLRRWGWAVAVDERLLELDFGAWDGRPWSQIAWADVDAWQADLLHHAPGGGETLHTLAGRVRAFSSSAAPGPRLVVTHGGWINALRVVVAGGDGPLDAAHWPAPVRCGGLWRQVLQVPQMPPPGVSPASPDGRADVD